MERIALAVDKQEIWDFILEKLELVDKYVPNATNFQIAEFLAAKLDLEYLFERREK